VDLGRNAAGATNVAVEEKFSEAQRAWWSFQPPRRPEVPKLARHPIDAFLLSKNREFAPPAEKLALMRRVYSI
jgi:hypothetical protein